MNKVTERPYLERHSHSSCCFPASVWCPRWWPGSDPPRCFLRPPPPSSPRPEPWSELPACCYWALRSIWTHKHTHQNTEKASRSDGSSEHSLTHATHSASSSARKWYVRLSVGQSVGYLTHFTYITLCVLDTILSVTACAFCLFVCVSYGRWGQSTSCPPRWVSPDRWAGWVWLEVYSAENKPRWERFTIRTVLTRVSLYMRVASPRTRRWTHRGVCDGQVTVVNRTLPFLPHFSQPETHFNHRGVRCGGFSQCLFLSAFIFFTHHSSCRGILLFLSHTVCLPAADAYCTPAWVKSPTHTHTHI